ncbi:MULTISPECIES: hypothetical protein [unclassified Bradyrhizobium]|uniref:hypothetical protein n=1 Tax=Bradyrhizobium sp. USDA 4541 TaxID=2817704 RepID=UPI0020A36D4C|nr:hypothetical protein [Bradyrhizobium sp. USDA 4541]MCP1851219.1 hypothetical protein [Bradyrhizobium sp. USDA 4541]
MSKSHCNYGHAMTPENTRIVQPRGHKYPWRQCRICMELTPADVLDIDAKMQAGAVIKDLGLSYAKQMGLEAYRKKNPEWSARFEQVALLNANKKKAAAPAFSRQTRSHCTRGHELTPETFDKSLMPEGVTSWNPRACLVCRNDLEWRPRRFTAEEVPTAKKLAVHVGISVGRPQRTHCKAGHRLTPENIAVMLTGKGFRHHICRLCKDLSEVEAAEILRKLTEGQTLKTIVMPVGKQHHSFDRYRAEHPDWDAIVTPLLHTNKHAARLAGFKAKMAARTHCKRGHEYTIGNTYYRFNGTRQCKTCNLLSQKTVKPIAPKMIELAKRALITNVSVENITRGPNRAMNSVQWRHLRLTDPEFNRFVLENVNGRSLGTMQSRMGIAPLMDITRSARIENVGADASIPVYVEQPGDFSLFYSLTPRYLSDQDRFDVVANIYIALGERRVRREDVPQRIREFTKQHTEIFPTGEYGSAKSPYSLDVAVFDDGKMTRHETAHIGLWSEDSMYA